MFLPNYFIFKHYSWFFPNKVKLQLSFTSQSPPSLHLFPYWPLPLPSPSPFNYMICLFQWKNILLDHGLHYDNYNFLPRVSNCLIICLFTWPSMSLLITGEILHQLSGVLRFTIQVISAILEACDQEPAGLLQLVLVALSLSPLQLIKQTSTHWVASGQQKFVAYSSEGWTSKIKIHWHGQIRWGSIVRL